MDVNELPARDTNDDVYGTSIHKASWATYTQWPTVT